MKTNHDIIRRAKVLYSSSRYINRIVKQITNTRIYYLLLKTWINHQTVKSKNGPFNLVIELTNLCNARCVMCPHQSMKRPLKIMDDKTFNLLINRLKHDQLKLNKILISGMGEPLTDQNLFNRLTRLKEFKIPIKLYTNASLMTEKYAKEIVDLGIEEINISFNGATPNTYNQVMGLNYAKTNANILNLLAIKQNNASKLPKIQISLIITKENEKQVNQYLATWQNKVDLVTVSKSHQWGGGVQVESGFSHNKNSRTYPCRSLWHTITIDSSGNIVICCRDYESQVILGNLSNSSLKAIQNHPILREYKKRHLDYSDKKLPLMCQKCNFPYQDGIEWLVPRSYD